MNKLATHVRQDVHAALKAMLGGHADAVATLVHTDHLDFARAELKEIAAKVSARVMDTTQREVDVLAGIVAGVVPLPAPPAPFAHEFEYALGQRFGAAIGFAADIAAFGTAVAMTGGGAGATVASAGALSAPGIAVSAAGLTLIGAAAGAAALHGARMLEPQRAPVDEARGDLFAKSPTAIDEKHIFEGQVKTAGDGTRRATGYHLESSTKNARVVASTRSAPDRNGIYSARVEILDPKSGRWLQKKAESTFFPDTYSKNDVRRAIQEAFAAACEAKPGLLEGRTKRGILIEMIVNPENKVMTAYPVMEALP